MEKCLNIVGLLLLIVSVTMAGKNSSTNSTGALGCEPSVCTSRDCVIVASKMASLMDPQTDPCQDFAQYACGGFYKDAVVPDDKEDITSYSSLLNDIIRQLRKFMADPIKNDNPEYIKKMKSFYSTCMDVDTIEEIGLKPYTTSKYPKDWPTLNPAWKDSKFNVNDLVEKYGKYIMPLFSIEVAINETDSSKYWMNLGQSGTSLPLDYYNLPKNDTRLLALQRYYLEIAVALGADELTAVHDAEDLIDLEKEFARISTPYEEMDDGSSMINPTTLAEMSVTYPYIDWHRAVQARFDLINYTVPRNLPVNIATPKYFAKLEGLLSRTSDARYKRVIQNKFGFAYAVSQVDSLTKQMRKITFKYSQIFSGLQKDITRWRQCFKSTSSYFSDVVSKWFVTNKFSETSKSYINNMVTTLKESFSGLLREADWMSPKTKEAAFLKINNLRVKIGYPDKDFSEDEIEHKYKNYTVWIGQFYRTVRNMNSLQVMNSLKKLNEAVDKEEFQMPAWWSNAYADPSANEIGFPAGILHPPFYSAQSPSSVNYGGIGSIIGHEITHVFDHYGSQYDYQGNLNNWWQLEDLKQYKNRTQCVIDQYSAFWLDEIDMFADGKATVADDVADIGGVKESYRAYKTYAASQPEEILLPGLGLTRDQQFFLAFAQSWCEKETPASLKARILRDESGSTTRLIIRGAISNNEDFAKVFQCPAGSPMNPALKCNVW